MKHQGYGSEHLNIFDKLSRQGIELNDKNDRFQSLFAVLDIETTNTKETVKTSEKLQFSTKLQMIRSGLCGCIHV